MAGAREQSKPTFFWQALLILLPVIVLATIGCISLRRDKLLARQEAAARAQMLADDLAPRLWNEIVAKCAGDSNGISFQVNSAGELLFPPAYAPLPVPSLLDVKELNAEQLRLWTAARDSGRPESLAHARQACDDFLSSNPPQNFAAAACYGAGMLSLREQKFLEAAESFGLILEKYPGSASESGIPFTTLARFKLLQLGPRETLAPDWSGVAPPLPLKYFVSMDSFCSNIVNSPSALTPRFFQLFQGRMEEEDAILAKKNTTLADGGDTDVADKLRERSKTPAFQEARVVYRKWQRIWDEHESARQLYATARESFRTNASLLFPVPSSGTNAASTNDLTAHLFWFNTPDWKPLPFDFGFQTNAQLASRNWLATRTDESPAGCWFHCLDEFQVGSWLRALTGKIKHPDYFGVAVELAGRKIGALESDTLQWHYEQGPGGRGFGGFYKVHAGADPSSLLASAAQFENGVEQLKVSVYLTSPSALFQDQRSRAIWFGSLMAASTAAALIGLFTAHRAFRRQLRLSEMKSNFVSSVSHELRAPIASVRLMAESLERGKVQEPGKQHEYFQFIVQECRRLSSLVENVLDFSRIEQGRKQYEFEPTDIAALTRRTAGLMETYAAERQVRLEVALPDSAVAASVDGKALQQALVNLIDNAVKHSPNGSPVRVGLEMAADSIQLWVEDQGEGIPLSEQEKIFERFYRLGSELRRETPGVGIGLSIVKHIVEEHDGHIIVRSAPGQGSRFTIELPINHDHHNETSNNEH
jgi:signal transduction histidine kinase